jgi:hypothetical protein
MTLKGFIHANREELERVIRQARDFVPETASCDCPKSRTAHVHDSSDRLSSPEIRQWVMNDEGLYAWARSEGVRV